MTEYIREKAEKNIQGSRSFNTGNRFYHTVSAEGTGALTVMIKPRGMNDFIEATDGRIELGGSNRSITGEGFLDEIKLVPDSDDDVYSYSIVCG